jgi:MEDS: MEthanogen/methylotroph, DcmR Sensory domain
MSSTNALNSPAQVNADHHAHVVQFYSEDRFLLDELPHFIGAALAAGNSAVVIATRGHADSLSQRLKEQGIDLDLAIADGRYVAFDAAETLARFMVGGLPDPARFSEVIGGVIARAASAAQDENHRVVAFGESVRISDAGVLPHQGRPPWHERADWTARREARYIFNRTRNYCHRDGSRPGIIAQRTDICLAGSWGTGNSASSVLESSLFAQPSHRRPPLSRSTRARCAAHGKHVGSERWTIGRKLCGFARCCWQS